MTPQRHLIFWSTAFAAFVLLVFLFKSILLPFVLGMIIAYLLNPSVNKLGSYKIPRGPAALLILCSFGLVVLAILAALFPLIHKEFNDFSAALPGYIETLKGYFENGMNRVNSMDSGHKDQAQKLIGDNAGGAATAAATVAGKIAVATKIVFDFLLLFIVTPIVAYFMMKDWPRITSWVIDILPKQNKETIMGLFHDIDKKLSGFIRGQFLVSFILGTFYAISLTIAGLKYGFLIGVVAGMLSIIPMVGSTVGLLTAVIVAWLQTHGWEFPAIVAAIFLFGQLVEGNFLTPKIVGDRVGLHPLWILFALMAGGALFGFIGLLLAVPVAAVLSVLIAFGLKKYKASRYYKAKKSG